MLFPKFSALQSRFAASFAASLVLVLLYLALSNPHLAYAAADADSIAHEDHNHPRLLELLHQPGLFDVSSAENELEGEDYTPEFAGLDRSIIGRADATIQTLDNNVPGKSNIDEGQTQYWTFPNKTLWGPFSPQTPGLPPGLSKRDAQSEQPSDIASDEETAGELLKRQTSPTNTRKVFLSINTCEQAHANDPNPNGAPPQLELYISQKSSNQKPDQNNNDGIVTVDGGYGEATLDATSDIWFTVSAPQSSNFGGSYNYELTASIDAPYASYNDSSNFGLNLVDTDINSALLYSSILVANKTDPQFQTQSDAWMNSPPRFSIYVHNQNDSAILGLHRSVCGLKNHAQIQGNMQEKTTSNVDTDMTKRGDGRPKQEFYVKNLNGSSAYYAIIGIDRSSTPSEGGVVGGGGTVWKVMNFTTKSDGNCQIVYNLSFCSDVAYAVPSNPNVANLTGIYENFTQSAYTNFSYSLQQIPCNTTSTAQYSLARTCADCDRAYKQWLCAVAVPRCEDFSSTKTWLQPRAVASPFINGTNGTGPEFNADNKDRLYANQSRSWVIDQLINPGPHKEVLPCIDLCYDLIQSCPAALLFACPLPNHGMNYSYGQGSEPFCNSLGTLQSAAEVVGVNLQGTLAAVAVILIFIMGS